MLDPDTFLTTLYVMTDTFCTTTLPTESRSGPDPSLTRSEVMTLARFGQWAQFQSERDFYRYAERHLRPAFPALPDRAQFNRLLRTHRDAISTFAVYLARHLAARDVAYEALDCSGVPTRNAKRRGSGWLAGIADIGWSNRLGWYEGVHVLLAVTPNGLITGFGFGAASTKDQPLADTFFALRHTPSAHLPGVGQPAAGPYVADTGFALRVRPIMRTGRQRTTPRSSARHAAPVTDRGRRPGVVGMLVCGTLWKRCTTSCITRFVWRANAHMTSRDCRHAWRPKSRCTTFVSG